MFTTKKSHETTKSRKPRWNDTTYQTSLGLSTHIQSIDPSEKWSRISVAAHFGGKRQAIIVNQYGKGCCKVKLVSLSSVIRMKSEVSPTLIALLYGYEQRRHRR